MVVKSLGLLAYPLPARSCPPHIAPPPVLTLPRSPARPTHPRARTRRAPPQGPPLVRLPAGTPPRVTPTHALNTRYPCRGPTRPQRALPQAGPLATPLRRLRLLHRLHPPHPGSPAGPGPRLPRGHRHTAASHPTELSAAPLHRCAAALQLATGRRRHQWLPAGALQPAPPWARRQAPRPPQVAGRISAPPLPPRRASRSPPHGHRPQPGRLPSRPRRHRRPLGGAGPTSCAAGMPPHIQPHSPSLCQRPLRRRSAHQSSPVVGHAVSPRRAHDPTWNSSYGPKSSWG